MPRFQNLIYSTVLVLIAGWVLYIGRDVFIPAVFGAVVVYVIVGMTDGLGKLPRIGNALPLQLRYTLSVSAIASTFLMLAYFVIANKEKAIALAPQYQESLLLAIQRVAVFLRIETEPTWATLRQDLFAQINIQRFVGSMVASVSSVFLSFVVVLLYATFLLFERRFFSTKLNNLSSHPDRVVRIRKVIGDINRRIGSYLALKAGLSLLLGFVSWIVMWFFGLEFAVFWAMLSAVLNFVPYIGSALGVLLPMGMAIVQFEELGAILSIVLALTAIQFVIGNFLDPYIMGSSLNLSPFAILISLAIWSELWGIAGAFLAVPITAIMVIVFSEFPGTRPVAVLLSQRGEV